MSEPHSHWFYTLVFCLSVVVPLNLVHPCITSFLPIVVFLLWNEWHFFVPHKLTVDKRRKKTSAYMQSTWVSKSPVKSSAIKSFYLYVQEQAPLRSCSQRPAGLAVSPRQVCDNVVTSAGCFSTGKYLSSFFNSGTNMFAGRGQG